MVLWMTGCVLFISDAEHAERLKQLSGETGAPDTSPPTDTGDTGVPPDTGDTGDTGEKSPYAGFYDGDLSITLDVIGSGDCQGEMELTVSFKGDIYGTGSCSYGTISPTELSLAFTGTVQAPYAGGMLMINETLKDTWQGQFYTSGPVIKLEGSFEGTYKDGLQEADYVGEFDLD